MATDSPLRFTRRFVLIVLVCSGAAFLIWEATAQFRYERLDRAIYSRDLARVRLWLSLGSDVNRRDYRPNQVEKNIPLMTAVMSGNRAIAALLLEKGANPNFQYGEGVSPLVFAAGRGDLQMLKLLLSHGARKDLATFYGTALDVATVEKQEQAIRLLEENGK